MPGVSLLFRVLAIVSTLMVMSIGAVGFIVRDQWRTAENEGFNAQVDGARAGIELELTAEQNAVQDLLRPVCKYDQFIDKVLVDVQAGRLDAGRRLALSQQVPQEMKALRLDELVLVTSKGEVLGAGHDPGLVGQTFPLLASQLLSSDTAFPRLRVQGKTTAGPSPAALLGRCVHEAGGASIGLIGARHLSAMLERLGKAYGVRVQLADSATSSAPQDEIRREVVVGQEPALRVHIARSRQPLDRALEALDRKIYAAGGITLLVAFLAAVVLARSITRPLSELSREVREVVEGEPHEVKVRGSSEMRHLALAFNKTLSDLATLRKRQAAVERIAAWREVARRVAHEIKNPLTPIRSSVETLRRLRARNDPNFDDYFEEASRGILDDVHRIATIASDFARFARLPSPKPAPIDVTDIARTVVAMHTTPGVQLELTGSPVAQLQADRDQLTQMLTNLVQNAMDAARAVRSDPRVEVVVEPCRTDQVRIAVRDNGPGVSKDVLPKLFEPYVTTKTHGTGLGLPIVQRIVVEHGGEIQYTVLPEGGACFTVLLPLAGPPAVPALQCSEI